MVFVNDIVDVIKSTPFLFADDTILLEVVEDIDETTIKLNEDLVSIDTWAKIWRVTFNAEKTEEMIFSTRRRQTIHPPLYFNMSRIERVTTHKHLGLDLSSDLSWSSHIEKITKKANKTLGLLRSQKWKLKRASLRVAYTSFVRSILDYGDILYDNCSEKNVKALERIQYNAAKTVSGAMHTTSYEKLLKELGWESLATRRQIHRLVLYFKMMRSLVPPYLCELVPQTRQQRADHALRNPNRLTLPRCRTEKRRKSFVPKTTSDYNNLPDTLKQIPSLNQFKLKTNIHFKPEVKPHYEVGDRRPNALLAMLRVGMSPLNSHLYSRGLIDSPKCTCNNSDETVLHFLLLCPNHAHHRNNLMAAIVISYPDFIGLGLMEQRDLLIYGNPDLSMQANIDIMLSTQKFLTDTNRFP